MKSTSALSLVFVNVAVSLSPPPAVKATTKVFSCEYIKTGQCGQSGDNGRAHIDIVIPLYRQSLVFTKLVFNATAYWLEYQSQRTPHRREVIPNFDGELKSQWTTIIGSILANNCE